LHSPAGSGLRSTRGIPNGFRRNTASEVLNHLGTESPAGLQLDSLWGSEEDKAFRLRLSIVGDMLATFWRHREADLLIDEAGKVMAVSVPAG
jgi:hypothetical protein